MGGTKRLSVDLPVELAQLVEAKVASGEYGSESEVVSDGLRALGERDEEVERWLRDEVVAAYDEHKRDPSRALTAEQVWANLQAHMDLRSKKDG